jgi:hypothetical protein
VFDRVIEKPKTVPIHHTSGNADEDQIERIKRIFFSLYLSSLSAFPNQDLNNYRKFSTVPLLEF